MSRLCICLMVMLGVFVLFSATACGGESDDAMPPKTDKPVKPGEDKPSSPDDNPDKPENPSQDGKTTTLTADGNTAQTYQLIKAAGFNYEVPDESRDHSTEPFQHIRQTYDTELRENVFLFYIHALIDDDRGLPNITDRQRNEIKTDSHSPKELVGQEGEKMVFRWKFKMPEGMKTTSRFCHLHQLKGLDNAQGTADVSTPLITITACSSSKGVQLLQVRHDERGAGTSTVAQTELLPLLGEWLSVEEKVTFGKNGSCEIMIKRISDGKTVLHVPTKSCDMWRTGSAGLRPKWGIYRYIGENRSMQDELRDEVVSFADFSITKLTTN